MAKYRIKDICDSNLLNIRNLSGDVSINYLDTSSITHGVISEYQVLRLKEAPSRAQRMVSNGTIIYSLVRPNLCHYGYIDRPIDNLVVSTGFLTLNLKKSFRGTIDIKFLYLLLTQPSLTQYLHIIAQNAVSAYPSLTPSDLEGLTFDFPEYDVQKRISSLFFDIDSKIALNREINRNLEAMARQLYDYWFVQFDFPDENGRPYKSSGGKMVWNEKLKREIPIEWEGCTLSDIANITMGQSPDGTSYNETGEGILFYQGSTDFGNRFPSVRQYTTAPTRFAHQGDILMSVRAPVGALNIANNYCCIGRGLSALSSKIGSQTHLYFVVDGLRMAFEQRNDSGTTFGSITKEDLHNLPAIRPHEDILRYFELICSPIFDIQMNIGEEIEKLTAQRNELLPLLMNGQVSVMPPEVNCDLCLLRLSNILTFDHILC